MRSRRRRSRTRPWTYGVYNSWRPQRPRLGSRENPYHYVEDKPYRPSLRDFVLVVIGIVLLVIVTRMQ